MGKTTFRGVVLVLLLTAVLALSTKTVNTNSANPTVNQPRKVEAIESYGATYS
jgi:hypothetical protein